jgi:hypothetical protein
MDIDIDALAKLLLARKNDLYRSVVDYCADNNNDDLTPTETAAIGEDATHAYTDVVTSVLKEFGRQPAEAANPNAPETPR